MDSFCFSRGWPATLVLALLLTSVIVGLNVKPVSGLEILSVDAPPQARPEDTFLVFLETRYEASGEATLTTVIQEVDTGAEVGRCDTILGEEGEIASRTTGLGVSIVVPAADVRAPSYAWHLMATVGHEGEFSTRSFEIEIVPSDAEPVVDIISLKARPVLGEDGDPIYVGSMMVIESELMYSVPRSTTVKILFQNNLGVYPWSLPRDVTEEDGWLMLETTSDWTGTFYDTFPFFGPAPLNPADEWIWNYRITAETAEGDVTEDESSLTISVLDVEERWAQMRDFDFEDRVAPGETFMFSVTGAYIFPGDSTGDIQVKIMQEDGSPVPGGETHEINGLRGRDSFRLEFWITAPDVEGEWNLGAELRISGNPDPVDQAFPFAITVTSAAGDATGYCRILEARVNGGEPPQRVAYGESFTVELDLSWDVPADTAIDVSIWDWDYAVMPLKSDHIAASGEEDLYTFTVEIEEARVPPRNGLWTLRATTSFISPGTGPQYTPDGWERIFQVDVAGAAPSVGGRIDWSVGGLQVLPYEPLSSDQAVFEAMIQANPIPDESKQVQVTCEVDGAELFSDYVTYDPGMGFLTVASAPWTATLGAHTMTWVVDPDPGEYDDPNRANNVATIEFSVVTAYTPPEPEPGEEPPPTGEEFDFYVTAVPVEQTARSSVTYAINVETLSGTPEPVTLELMSVPTGASYYFEPASGTPTYSSTLTVTTSADTSAGTYPMTIKASGGGVERYLTINLIVEEGPDYSLSVSPRSARGRPSQTLEFTVSVSSDTRYSQYVNLLVSGAPSGITWTMNPTASRPNFDSTLTVEIGRNVRQGVYRLTITGSGPEERTSTITITVEGEPAPLGTPENTINTFAGIILGVIVAAIAGGAFVAVRRFRGKGKKQGAFCIECGSAIPHGSDFCSKCGARHGEHEEK